MRRRSPASGASSRTGATLDNDIDGLLFRDDVEFAQTQPARRPRSK
jgi:hypothetical protein